MYHKLLFISYDSKNLSKNSGGDRGHLGRSHDLKVQFILFKKKQKF